MYSLSNNVTTDHEMSSLVGNVVFGQEIIQRRRRCSGSIVKRELESVQFSRQVRSDSRPKHHQVERRDRLKSNIDK